jgi:hypothetical protein
MCRKRFAAITIALITLLALLVPLASEAGRPLVVDDAGAVAPGDFELELGLSLHGDGSVRHYDLPATLTYGLVPTLEIGLGFGGQYEEREELLGGWEDRCGVGDFFVGAKWNPLSEEQHWVSQALALTWKLPTADHDLGSGESDVDLTWIASKTLGEKSSAHLNVGYTWTGNPSEEAIDDVLHCGVAAGWFAAERVECVAELFSDIPISDEEHATLVLNGGIRWAVLDRLILDAAAGAGLRGDAPDWMATVGCTWTFGIKKRSQ